MKNLGTVTEAAETLGVDGAEIFEMNARGLLRLTHEDPESATWTVWLIEEGDQ